MEAFAKGTFAIADTLADLTDKGVITIIGGGMFYLSRWFVSMICSASL